MLRRLKDFRYFEPKTLVQTLEILTENHNSKILAGGTDLLVKIKTTPIDVFAIVNIKHLSHLNFIEEEINGIRIGSLTTINDIAKSNLINSLFPPLSLACKYLGSTQVRNRATIGGNLCNASPAAETAAPLLIYNTELSIVGKKGKRKVSLEDFFVGPNDTILKTDEILVDLFIPKPPIDSIGLYVKHSPRRAMDICVAGIAVLAKTKNKAFIEDIRIAFNALNSTPVRGYKIENFLIGKVLDSDLITEAGKMTEEIINPINDVRASANYRRAVTANSIKSILEDICTCATLH